MLRKLFLLPVLGLFVVPAIAQAQFEAGNWELTLSGSGSNDKEFDAASVGIGGSLGYFFTKELEGGVRQSVNYFDGGSGGDTAWGGSTVAFVDYHFDMGAFQPFVGANVGYFYPAGSTGSGGWAPEGGVKYFVNSTTFIYGMVQYFIPFQRPSDAFFEYSLGIGFKW